MFSKMSGEFQKCRIFLANSVEDADGVRPAAAKADDLAARSAKFALYGLHPIARARENALQTSFSVRRSGRWPFEMVIHVKDTIEGSGATRKASRCETARGVE